MSVKLINLTPHTIVLRGADGVDHPIPPSGVVARVATTPGTLGAVDGVPVPVMGRTLFGDVEGLPASEEGTMFVVSALVGSALGGSRDDVLQPGTGPRDEAIRDADGRIVAVTRLIRA